MTKVGYTALKEMFGLPDIPLHVTSHIVSDALKL